MQDLILQITLMLSLGTIVYLFALAIPRVGEPEVKQNPIRKMISNIPLHHVDATLDSLKDKLLRRAKIIVLKIENFINKSLHKDKDNSGLGGPKL